MMNKQTVDILHIGNKLVITRFTSQNIINIFLSSHILLLFQNKYQNMRFSKNLYLSVLETVQ